MSVSVFIQFFVLVIVMTEDGKVSIQKFDGQKFGWWKMQIEALLCQKDLDVVFEDEKPEKLSEADWKKLDKKARACITLSLSEDVAFNVMKETTARGMMDALSNMYEKPSAANKVNLIRELVTTRMNRVGQLQRISIILIRTSLA